MTAQSKVKNLVANLFGEDTNVETLNKLEEFVVNTDINNISALYWIRKLHIDNPILNVHELFSSVLNGSVRKVQQFNEVSARRRVYSHIEKTIDPNAPNVSLFVKGPNGVEEKWSPTVKVINQGKWVAVPTPDQYVGYGIALEALQNGLCDLIRCEDWTDEQLYLRLSDKTLDSLPPTYLINLSTKAIFTPSNISMFSRNWIMINIPRSTVNAQN